MKVLDLHDARGRREHGAFIAEGERCIGQLLLAGWRPQLLLCREDVLLPVDWPAMEQQRVSAAALNKASALSSPPGLLAVFAIPTAGAVDPAAGGLLCDGISDPGNLGTLLRCAAAFGLGQVVLVGGADPWAPKVVQSSAGCLAALTVHRVELPALGVMLAAGAVATALVARGGRAPQDLPKGPRWLVLGSEAHGISPELSALCGEQCTLPMPGDGAESLNAHIAAAIAMYLLR